MDCICEDCGEMRFRNHKCKAIIPTNIPPYPTEGVKYDQDKPDFTLLPYDSLVEVAKVLQYGADKYPEADNWKRVDDALNRYKKANLRHSLQAVYEDKDPESKLYHLAHAICCDLFALHFILEEKNDKQT